MKVLIDMNLSPDWVALFQSNDIEAVHWSSVGPANAPDWEIFRYAVENEYAVFTHDLEFSAILAATNLNAPSVIQVRTQNNLPAAIGELVIRVFGQLRKELEEGALLTIDPNKVRVRILPLRS